MERLVCLALLTAATTARAESFEPANATPKSNQLRTDLAFSGPGGLIAMRYSRVLSSGTRIEPAIGVAYTGYLGSLLVTQPLTTRQRRTGGGTAYSSAFEVYGGYGASVLGGPRHP